MMHCSEAGELITALVDGELDLTQMGTIQAHLDRCEDCQARKRMETQLKGFLSRRLAEVDPPSNLAGQIRSALGQITPDGDEDPTCCPDMPTAPEASGTCGVTPAPPTRRSWWFPLVFILAILLGMSTVLMIMKLGATGSPGVSSEESTTGGGRLAFELVGLHTAATGAGVFQTRLREIPALNDWFFQQLGFAVSLPDLSASGLEPVGARVARLFKESLGMVLYRDPKGGQVPVTLLVAQADTALPVFPTEAATIDAVEVYPNRFQGVQMAYFGHSDATWVLASMRDAKGLLPVVKGVLAH